MADWILSKATAAERTRQALRKRDRHTRASMMQPAKYCQVCGAEIRAGSLCSSCAEYIRSRKAEQRQQ